MAAAERLQTTVVPQMEIELVPAWVHFVASKSDKLLARLLVMAYMSPVHPCVVEVFATGMDSFSNQNEIK